MKPYSRFHKVEFLVHWECILDHFRKILKHLDCVCLNALPPQSPQAYKLAKSATWNFNWFDFCVEIKNKNVKNKSESRGKNQIAAYEIEINKISKASFVETSRKIFCGVIYVRKAIAFLWSSSGVNLFWK